MTVELPPGFGVRQCSAAFEGARETNSKAARARVWEQNSNSHNILSFFCSDGKRRGSAALHDTSENQAITLNSKSS